MVGSRAWTISDVASDRRHSSNLFPSPDTPGFEVMLINLVQAGRQRGKNRLTYHLGETTPARHSTPLPARSGGHPLSHAPRARGAGARREVRASCAAIEPDARPFSRCSPRS